MNKNKEIIKKNIEKNMTDEQKQKYRESGKHKYQNMTDAQKRKYIEAIKNHQKNIEKT